MPKFSAVLVLTVTSKPIVLEAADAADAEAAFLALSEDQVFSQGSEVSIEFDSGGGDYDDEVTRVSSRTALTKFE